jgi:predicted amidophosphoribosyltransferase
MAEKMNQLKKFILDLVFPCSCFICKRQGDYICQDCRSVLEILNDHWQYQGSSLDDLYFPLTLENPFIGNLINKFKNEPFVKDLAKPLSSLIIEHFELLDNKPDFSGFSLVPVPVEIKELKWRGFNQNEELAKELALSLKIPLIEKEKVAGKEILLVNDVFDNSLSMQDCARSLRKAGAIKIIGLVIARK